MRKSGLYSPQAIKSIVTYCNRFPEALVRQGNGWKSPCQMLPSNFYMTLWDLTHSKKKLLLRRWKYQDNVNEFYVITNESTTIKLAELEKQLEATEVDATCPFQDGDPGDELSLGWLQWGFKSIAPKIPIVPKKKPTLNIYIYMYIYINIYITNIQPTFVLYIYIPIYISIYHISYICI